MWIYGIHSINPIMKYAIYNMQPKLLCVFFNGIIVVSFQRFPCMFSVGRCLAEQFMEQSYLEDGQL